MCYAKTMTTTATPVGSLQRASVVPDRPPADRERGRVRRALGVWPCEPARTRRWCRELIRAQPFVALPATAIDLIALSLCVVADWLFGARATGAAFAPVERAVVVRLLNAGIERVGAG